MHVAVLLPVLYLQLLTSHTPSSVVELVLVLVLVVVDVLVVVVVVYFV